MCLETQILELFIKDIREDFQCQNFQRDHLVKAAFRQQMKPKFKVPKDYIFAERANILHTIWVFADYSKYLKLHLN